MPPIFLRPKAEEDLYEIWRFIALERQNPLNADRFLDQMQAQFLALAQNPSMGLQKLNRFPTVYQFPFKEYLIFYSPLKKGIEIIRVLHGRRKISNIW